MCPSDNLLPVSSNNAYAQLTVLALNQCGDRPTAVDENSGMIGSDNVGTGLSASTGD
jgi:hypothetical protein